MENRNNKTEAILRLHNLKNDWAYEIEYNDGRMEELLKKIGSDIFEGYVTYESFLEIIIESAGAINFKEEHVTEAVLNKYISVVKHTLFLKYSELTNI